MMLTAVETFWNRHPALFYGLTALLAFYSSVKGDFILIIPLLILWGPFCALGASHQRIKLLWSLGIFTTLFLYSNAAFQHPNLPNEGIYGQLHFDIETLSSSQAHFSHQWIYQGKGVLFTPEDPTRHDLTCRNFLCSIRQTAKKGLQRPSANYAYRINGTLKARSNGSYYFLPTKGAAWEPIDGSWGLAEWRQELKAVVKKYIHRSIQNPKSAAFLAGIITGDFEDQMMRQEFGKTGLQHIMAISGFHFALLAMMLGGALRWLPYPRINTWILILLLTAYVIALGGSPSVLRAWLMCLIYLSSLIAEKRSLALNSLGVGILCIIFYNPLLTLTIGFQFSVVTTASILLWFPIIHRGLSSLFPTRHLGLVTQMSLSDQHSYCVLSIFKGALALAFAVNITAIPMALYLFGKFPILSLLYNLFIPFMVSIAMFLLIVSLAISWILPPLGGILYSVTNSFTHYMLDFIYNVPNNFQYYWNIAEFPTWCIACYLSALFVIGGILFVKNQLDRLTWSYV